MEMVWKFSSGTKWRQHGKNTYTDSEKSSHSQKNDLYFNTLEKQ